MTNEPNISVIMCVYNQDEVTLRESIKTVRRQYFRDFELIIVNDGSTNNAEDVLLSIQDERFKYIKQNHLGLSKARNEGLKIAKGKYIFFMSPNDELDLNALQQLFDRAEQQDLDILVFNPLMVENEVFNHNSPVIFDNLFYITNDYIGRFFKNEFLTKNNLFFTDELIFEDMEFSYRCLFKAERIGYFNCAIYTKALSSVSSKDDYFNLVKFFDLIESHLIKINLFDKVKIDFYTQKIYVLSIKCLLIEPELKDKFKDAIKESLKNIKLKPDETFELEHSIGFVLKKYQQENRLTIKDVIEQLELYIEFIDYINEILN